MDKIGLLLYIMKDNKQLRRKRKLYKMVVNDPENSGVNAISLVLTPAIMREFVALSKTPTKRVKLQEEKRILVSPVLIPEIEIPQNFGSDVFLQFKICNKQPTFKLFRNSLQKK